MGGGRGDYESLSDRVGYDMRNVGWTTVPLGNVADINMGQSPPSSTVNEDGLGVPFIQGNAEFGPRSPQPVKYCSKPQKEARLGDLLLSVRAPVGALNLADQPLCIGRGLSAITATGVESAFLWHALRREVLGLTRVAQGSTFSAVNKADLRTLEIPLPPVGEQRKIAAILSSVDDAIEKTQAVIDQVQVVKRGLMQELLTRGLPGRHTRFKQTEIGEIPEAWGVVSLAESGARVTSGSRGWAKYYSDDGALFLRITNLARNTIRLQLGDIRHVALPEGSAESRRTRAQPGDLIISITADLGMVGVIPDGIGEAYVNQHIALVRFPGHEFHPEFAGYSLTTDTARNRFNRLNDSGAKAGLNLPTIMKLTVPQPPRDEQDIILKILTTMEDRHTGEGRKLDGLTVTKSALMSALLTGELRVTPDTDAA